jgi:polysaccharide biosynthesis/export protein
MSVEKRKRLIAMWTARLSRWFTRVALLVYLALAAIIAWGSDSPKPAVTPEASKASQAGQDSRKTAGQPNTPIARRADDDYIIGPSDVLAINVWKDPELTRTVPVRPDGKISLPLIGELEVSGLTALNVQHLVAQRLKEYISKPEVTVIVQEVKSRTYIIVGKISRPGAYELGKPTTVLEAIAIAGGFQDFAKPTKIYVIRRMENGSRLRLPFDYNKVIKGRDPDENVNLKSGDTIVVP